MYCHQNHRLIHYFCDLEYIFFFVFLFLGRVQIYIPVTVIFCIYIKTAKFTTYFLQSLIYFWKIIWSKKWRKKNYKTCPHYTDNIIYKRKYVNKGSPIDFIVMSRIQSRTCLHELQYDIHQLWNHYDLHSINHLIACSQGIQKNRIKLLQLKSDCLTIKIWLLMTFK